MVSTYSCDLKGDYLEAQLAEELFSCRYFVQRPKELFCEPAPSDGR